MDDMQKQVVERLKQANNILVTVRNNPTIDLLSACIGLALVLDKLDKHAAAVFSGAVPSALEFLKPEDTIERTPDSLRDFIIALDKSKADKLRYKVEDKVVRIFITPYKTSLSEKDLEFSQGDFNVDAIVALGAREQEELDQAITAHGRILHDAVIISINNTPDGNLGSLHWQDTGASSISEMVSQLVKGLDGEVLDGQIATALLTGIVAETERFSNEKTTPETMNVAGELMAAGANQQLVASSLQSASGSLSSAAAKPTAANASDDSDGSADGTLDIDHEEGAAKTPEMTPEPPESAAAEPVATRELPPVAELPHISNVHVSPLQETPFSGSLAEEAAPTVRSYLVDESSVPGKAPKPDTSIGSGNANPFDLPAEEPPAPLLKRDMMPPSAASGIVTPSSQPADASLPPAPATGSVVPPNVTLPSSLPPADITRPAASASQPASMDTDHQTLDELEQSLHSPHVQAGNSSSSSQPADVDSARSQVASALQQGASQSLPPMMSLGANPLGDELHHHVAGPPEPPAPAAPDVTPPIEVDPDGNLKQLTSEPSANQLQDHPLPPVTAEPVAPPSTQPEPAEPLPGSVAPPPGPPPFTPVISSDPPKSQT